MDKIPEGYKKTEIGFIPDDWEVKKIKDISLSVSAGKSVTKGLSGKYKIYGSTGIIGSANRYDYVGKKILIARVGANAGTVNKVRGEYCVSDNTLMITLNNNVNYEYLFYQLKNFGLYRLIFGSGQPLITGGQIKEIFIQLPPVEEQSIIATSLSDIDSLVTSLEKLIEKKKMIRQGVMQELLTGNRRLAGFSGEWNEVELSEIGKTYGGLSGKVKSDFGNGSSKYIPFMNIMNNPIINTSFLERVNIKPSENQEKAQKGDLFFNGSSETPEEVGMCSVLTEDITDLYLNSFCFGFRLKEKHCTNGLWLAYYFRSDVGRELIFSLAQGATRYNLSKTNFVKLKIKCPTPDEQVAIAGVIEAADSEISKLECKLSKLKQIKQGAMQQLLTGKIRLINK